MRLYSIVVPARNEEGAIAETVQNLHETLRREGIAHEIVVVDDGSTDSTWSILETLRARLPELAPVRNRGEHGFGRAVVCGLDRARGDAVAIVMADDSDDPQDVVRYWRALEAGSDCAFGSRFLRGGGARDYPAIKLALNRAANLAIRLAFGLAYNDVTNAFKAYRRGVIEGCRPLESAHFELTVELPLKAIVRGYTYAVLPITWRNRRCGLAKLKIREMGSRYLAVCWRVWREKRTGRSATAAPL